MYKGNSSRILPIVLVLIVVAIAIAALVSIGRVIFGGGGSKSSTTDTSQAALLDTSATHSVQMTVRGPIVANEDFRSYRITVDPTSRNLTTFSGYLDQTLSSKQLGNNTRAYEQFVYALNKANLAKGTPFGDDRDDTRGICATGDVYEFEVFDGGNTVKRLWTSTCRGSGGSLKASVSQLSNLFLGQIPDNQKILDPIDL